MPLLVGLLLAVAVGLVGSVGGLDRDRALYPAVMIVVASYYALFAVMGESTHALVLEILAGTAFLGAAIAGFRSTLWVVAAALAAHGLFDSVHDRLITNPGMPAWWPQFCGSIDVGMAVWLAWRLKRGRIADRPGNPVGLAGVRPT